jgi:hypothetical protein
MLERLSGSEIGMQLPDEDTITSQQSHCRCHQCDHDLYCGEECRRRAWLSYHRFTCVRHLSPNQPLLRLEDEWKSVIILFFM